MHVFTEEWVHLIANRYKQVPLHSRSDLYFVATSDEYRELRNEIEGLVCNLPQTFRKGVISKLRDPKNFSQTYHELVAGNLFLRLGYQIDYEQTINGLTPDWYVYSNNNDTKPFFAEVLTDNISDIKKSEQGQIRDLRSRLRQIPVGVALYISYDYGAVEKVVMDQKTNKKTATDVKNWLTKNKPPIGERLYLNGLILEIIHYNLAYSSVQYIGPTKSSWVNPEPLSENIKKKIKKYKTIIIGKGVPFVVCIFTDKATGFDLSILEDVLLGQRQTNVIFEEKTGIIVSQDTSRRANGLFNNKKSPLSAAIWIYKKDNEWKYEVLSNDNALNPLPINSILFQR